MRTPEHKQSWTALAALIACFSSVAVSDAAAAPQANARHGHASQAPRFECGYRSPAYWMAEVRAAVARGEIPDPAKRKLPVIPKGNPGPESAAGCLSRAHIFQYPDRNGLLLSNFSNGQLVNFMVQAANALVAQHGDNFDFIGYWTNFVPHHPIGTAFYKYIENDVRGIGDPSTKGTPIFNLRPSLGLAGKRIEGFIMMWNINSNHWQPGSGPNASFTRLVLGQEFEHRFAMYLPNLRDGRRLQGGTRGCSRTYHWNWRVDGQGSCMEISEWVGSNPATLRGKVVTFNTDITGGIFSYTDLYLMGYVSPSEMDAGNSELRYMDTSTCGSQYFGKISRFSSADIIASAGPRIPDSTKAQKEFRTAWIMIHQPSRVPNTPELDKAVGILQQHEIDWRHSTLGRGTMDNSLFGTCGLARVYGCGVNPLQSMQVLNGVPSLGSTLTLGVHNPVNSQPAGSVTLLMLASEPDPAFPCGTRIPGVGMRGRGAAGELLVSAVYPNPFLIVAGLPWFGAPSRFRVLIPVNQALIGARFYAQGAIIDPIARLGVGVALTDAVVMRLGL